MVGVGGVGGVWFGCGFGVCVLVVLVIVVVVRGGLGVVGEVVVLAERDV